MEPTEPKFIADVAQHVMTILRDDGVHRHIQFKRKGTRCYQFDLITWPGYLCYTGDMGTYVFTRLHDMFEFFRTDRNDLNHNRDGGLSINPGYWGEKLEAVDKCDGYKKYSEDKFKEVVNDILRSHFEDDESNTDHEASLRAAVEDELFCNCENGYDAHAAASNFEHDGFTFSDFWEYDLTEYSFRFMWCCYALAWGIKQYDDAKVEVPA